MKVLMFIASHDTVSNIRFLTDNRKRRKYLIALAVSLDGNFVQFSFGDNSNLGVEVNTKSNIKYNELN